MRRRITIGLAVLFVAFAIGGFVTRYIALDVAVIAIAGAIWLGLALIAALVVARGISVMNGDEEW